MDFTNDQQYAVDTKKQIMDGKLYRALMIGNINSVVALCQKVPDHALHIVSNVSAGTVLHMATYGKEVQLALNLLDDLPEHHLDKLTRQNGIGNTILHEAAVSNDAIPIADKVLRKVPGLLGMRNNNGETALLRAARHGQIDMFKFLCMKLTGYDQANRLFYLQRTDKTTVLHMAILSHHFELGFHIANEYGELINEKDGDGMTALQLLSCDSSGFEAEKEEGFLHSLKLYCSKAYRNKIHKEKRSYKWAVMLAKLLVARDTSWELSYAIQDKSKPKIHKYGEASETHSSMEVKGVGETPLILATMSGITEIVEEILKIYPQAVEYVDHDGRSILHVAVKYRRLEIFELVNKMELPMKRLARRIDNNSDTVLHTVGIKPNDVVVEKMESPAFLLQEELLWFERVDEVIPPHLKHHMNRNRQTAYEFFITTNSELRDSSKDWLKSTSQGCSVVAVLIATVAFAAAYTVPGGNNESNGLPVLGNRPLFIVFAVADALSLTFSLTSVVTFLSILTSSYRFRDFKNSLPNKLMLGFTFLFLSVTLLMVAFGATILLMIHNKENWAKIGLYALSFIPVGIFALAYFPLYSSLSKTYKYLLEKMSQTIPFSICFQFLRNKSSLLDSTDETSLAFP